jgi:hypothetical protein
MSGKIQKHNFRVGNPAAVSKHRDSGQWFCVLLFRAVCLCLHSVYRQQERKTLMIFQKNFEMLSKY